MAIIGSIRKHAGLAVALIGIAIIGFVVQDAFGRRGQTAPPVAVIEGESISYDLFNLQVDQLTDQYMQSQGGNVSLTDADREQIRDIAWQRMLSDLLMNNACEATGIQVCPAEMNDMYYGKFISPYLYQYFTNPQTGQYDRQQVMNIINNFSTLSPQDQSTLAELERIIKTERLKEKYFYLASKSYYVPKALAALQASRQNSSVTARYVSLPYSQVADSEVEPDRADYQKFYNENKYMFKQNKSRECRIPARRKYPRFRQCRYHGRPFRQPLPQQVGSIPRLGFPLRCRTWHFLRAAPHRTDIPNGKADGCPDETRLHVYPSYFPLLHGSRKPKRAQ